MNSPRLARAVLVFALAATAVFASACGSASVGGERTATSPAAGALEPVTTTSLRLIRRSVLIGMAGDFAQGTGVGGPRFESCLRRGMSSALDRPAITRLVQIYRRPSGQQLAAQALNAMALPLAARCGHRDYVPELVEASRRLRVARAVAPAARRLRITYGPYLGVKCRRAGRTGCDLVGIDVVLSAPAEQVVAAAGSRRIALTTPGMHSAVPHHDWVGTFAHAGFRSASSPFHLPAYGPHRSVWAGSPPVYVPIDLRVSFADGRTATARFHGVFLSPGWG